MTPSDAARLSALEARERARDAALISFAHHLSCTIDRGDGAASNLCWAIQEISKPAAPPSPPAAEGEAALDDAWYDYAGYMGSAPELAAFKAGWNAHAAPGPSPETIARVVECLRSIERSAPAIPMSYYAEKITWNATEALRLLDAERETGK